MFRCSLIAFIIFLLLAFCVFGGVSNADLQGKDVVGCIMLLSLFISGLSFLLALQERQGQPVCPARIRYWMHRG